MTATPHHHTLRSIIDLAEGPREGALLVVGEPGIGKTRLLSEAVDGTPVPSTMVRTNPHEAAYAMSGLESVLVGLSMHLAPDLERRAASMAEGPGQELDAAHHVLDVIQAMRLPATLLLVDDVDRMDAHSQAVLGLVAGRLLHTGLRLVVTARTMSASAPLGGIPRRELRPLPPDVLADEVRDPGHEPSESTVRVLSTYCRGNPSLLREHLERLDPDQARGDAWLQLPPRGGSWSAVLTAPILDGLDARQRTALDVVALSSLAHPLVLGLVDSGLPGAVDELVDEGVLSRRGQHVAFRDARLRSRIYWSQSSASRREGHARLAAAARGRSEHLEAWHGSFDGEPVGVEALLRSAVGLVASGDVAAAVELAERALQRVEHVDRHLDTIIGLCSQLLRHGEVVLAARYSHHPQVVDITATQALRLAFFELVHEMVTSQQLVDDQVRALAELHAGNAPDTAAGLQLAAAWFRAERWETAEARALLPSTAATEGRLSDKTVDQLGITIAALDAIDGVKSTEGATVTGLGSLDGSEPAPLLMQARAHSLAERHGEARDLFNIVLHYPTALDPVWTDLARLGAVGNEVAAGQFRRARECATAWDPDSPWAGLRSSGQLYVRAWIQYSVGRTDDADEVLQRSSELASLEGAPATMARALALRGTIALLRGDADTSVTLLRQVTGYAARFRNPTLLRQWADYAEACVATGRHREATRLLSSLEARQAAHPSRWAALAIARMRALTAEGEASLPLFTAAAGLFEPGESPYEQGRTLAVMATRLTALGHAHEGARARTLAVAAFDIAGATGWAVRGASEHGIEATPVRDQLSDEEWVVATHVKDGLRTRDIAAAMFMSVRTVELRLTAIYRRIGVASRSELVAEMLREGG
ncbi:hypothetical protein ASF37_10995 [Aeromicrobium sp. Leaf289]|uniref:helix-turn-helix transcriptional regulator n=1 Tax=Aeromicrobium sp. Leaf289 TaxID=1736324 RepID=UPI0006F355DA|nr:LuxR C-terminal-related transcriptional regulator [Aeromicrobium sp. Leaf289]KQP78997.1 hypothetical protein ASF37_10995 [Aeromicrobium sp. Leaf289]